MKKIIIQFVDSAKLLYCFFADFHFYIKHSLINPVITQDKSNAQIMLVMHALEKGMSFPSARIFGGEKAVRLIRLLDKHIEQYGLNKVCIVAINILAEYLKSPYATRDEESRNRICDFLGKNKKSITSSRIGGTKKVSEPSCFDKKIIEEFYASRVSVREYSDDPVTDDEIREACRIASYTPSACNRQASRIHVFRDKNVIRKLLDNQLGTQGWCDNASVLICVTVNCNYFGGNYERYQALIDGGLYAMNFVMGLHLNHIASCFKMFIRTPRREKEFKKIAKIPQCEMPVVLILGGHYKSGIVTSPKSERFTFDELACVDNC